jgi:hypothetical protein
MRPHAACALGAALATSFAAGTALAQETPSAPPTLPAPPGYYAEPAPPPGYVVVPAPPPPPAVYSVAPEPPSPYQYRPGPMPAYGVEYGRSAPRLRGRWLWGPTMGALIMPEASRVGMSFGFFAFREVGDWGFGFDGRVASTNWQHDDGAQFSQISFGGRRYFGDGPVSAFVGLGLSLSHVSEPGGTATTVTSSCIFSCSTSTSSNGYDLSGGGAGAYGEVGIELFRDEPTRVIASIRVDAPFYSLATDDGVTPSDDTILNAATSQYELPLTLAVGIAF